MLNFPFNQTIPVFEHNIPKISIYFDVRLLRSIFGYGEEGDSLKLSFCLIIIKCIMIRKIFEQLCNLIKIKINSMHY